MKKLIGFFFLLLLLSCTDQGSGEQIDSSSLSFNTYVSEKGFDIQYPDNFDVKEGYMGTDVIFLSSLNGEGDLFQENLNILLQDLSKNPMTLEEYTQLSINQIGGFISESKILESDNTIRLENNSAQSVIYTGKQGQKKLKWLQVWTVVDDTAYLLTYTAEEKNFDMYYSIMQKMISSFSINK